MDNKTNMLVASMMLLVLHAVRAEGKHDAALETRYGNVEVNEVDGRVVILYARKAVRSFEADTASLFRITPKVQNEYVIVQANHGGLHCRHFFVLLELSSQHQARASEEFGECTELDGAGFSGSDPVVHLKSPYIRSPDRSPSLISSGRAGA